MDGKFDSLSSPASTVLVFRSACSNRGQEKVVKKLSEGCQHLKKKKKSPNGEGEVRQCRGDHLLFSKGTSLQMSGNKNNTNTISTF